MIFAGNVQPLHGAEPDAEKDEVEFGFEFFERFGGIDADAEAELDAHAANHLDFAQAVGGAQLVFGHAVGIQAAGQRAALEDGGRRALAAELGGTGQRRRAAADAGDAQVARPARSSGQFLAGGMEGIHGVALQAARSGWARDCSGA